MSAPKARSLTAQPYAMLSAFATPITRPRLPFSISPTREFGSQTVGSGSTALCGAVEDGGFALASFLPVRSGPARRRTRSPGTPMRGGLTGSPECARSHSCHAGHHEPWLSGASASQRSGSAAVRRFRARQELIVAARMARRAHDAGVVAAAREHEGDLGARQVVQLVDGAPGRDVVGHRADKKTGTLMSASDTSRPPTR